jgi:pimeloyl-ACP methyl ester carboxylesterase
VLDALGVAVAIPVGHHTGAVIAVELAASAPERIAKVVLSGPVYVDAPGRDQLAAHFHQWRVAQDGSHLTDKWRKFLAWGATPSLAQRIVRDLFRAGETSEQGHFAVAAYPMETRLALVQCGALLLFHAGDAFTDPARAAPLAAAFSPVVTAHTDAGVFAANEAPHAFADAVLAYLSADQDRSR